MGFWLFEFRNIGKFRDYLVDNVSTENRENIKVSNDSGRRRGNNRYNGLYSVGSARKRSLFRLQVYERVGISQVEVYERVGKCVIHLKDEFYGLIKSRKRSIFVFDSYLKGLCHSSPVCLTLPITRPQSL